MAILADNLSGYRNRVRRWLHELTPTKSFWSDTFIDQQINVAYRRRCAHLVASHEGSEQERYAWPPGFERLLKMEIVRTDGTTVPIGREERHYTANPNSGGGTQDSYRPNYRPIGGGFVLEPAPEQTITDGVRIEFYGLPAELTNNGDSWHVDFPRSMDELIILDSVVACLDSENLMETGMPRTVLRLRGEWEMDWERYIDSRMISTNKIKPFSPHYGDA